MPVGDIYIATQEFEYQGNPNSYNFYLQVRAEADAEAVLQDVLDFSQERQDAWVPLHNPSVNFRCVTARQIYPTFSLPKQNVVPISGGRSCTPPAGHLPGQCCAVVTLYGDKSDPTSHNRGRDFITGMCVDDQLNGKFGSGVGSYLEELCLMYVAMTNQYVAGGNEFDIGVYSPSRAKPAGWPGNPSIPPYFWTLEAVRGRELCRTQRRRQPLDPCEIVCDEDIAAV